MRRRRYALMLAANAAAWSSDACRSGQTRVGEGPLLVLPFAVEPASEAWMGEPLAEEARRTLARAGATVAQPRAPNRGEYLLTAMLVEGAGVTARVRLSRTADSSIVFDQVLQFALESLSTLPGQITFLVTDAFGRPAGPAARLAPTRAYRTYLRALAYRGSGDIPDVRWAAELFRQVIAADSGFAPAWRGLTECLRRVGGSDGGATAVERDEFRLATARLAALDSAMMAGPVPRPAGGDSLDLQGR